MALFPTSPVMIDVTVESEVNNIESESSYSFKRQVTYLGGHRWMLSAKFYPMALDEFRPLQAFVMTQRGSSGTFEVRNPATDTPRGSVTGTISVNGANQTGASIYINGFVPGTANVFKAGDVIQPSGGTKVHLVTADASAGTRDALQLEDGTGNLLFENGDTFVLESTGQASVSIEPALTRSPADDETVNYQNVQYTMALVDDKQKYSVARPTMHRFEVKMKEVIA